MQVIGCTFNFILSIEVSYYFCCNCGSLSTKCSYQPVYLLSYKLAPSQPFVMTPTNITVLAAPRVRSSLARQWPAIFKLQWCKTLLNCPALVFPHTDRGSSKRESDRGEGWVWSWGAAGAPLLISSSYRVTAVMARLVRKQIYFPNDWQSHWFSEFTLPTLNGQIVINSSCFWVVAYSCVSVTYSGAAWPLILLTLVFAEVRALSSGFSFPWLAG